MGEKLKIKVLSAGQSHVLALCTDGFVWSWGDNSYGQLGDGTVKDRYSPVRVEGLSDVVAVAAGDRHSLAVTRDGYVWVWGSNDRGQLGNGKSIIDYVEHPCESIPVCIRGLSNIESVFASDGYSLALSSDGSVWSWGSNEYGQLGIKPSDMLDYLFSVSCAIYPFPARVECLSGVKFIAAGQSHALALCHDGSVWSWGNNRYGQVGNGKDIVDYIVHHDGFSFEGIPICVEGLSGVESVAVGDNHSLAVCRDGSLWGWGNNCFGQLGNSVMKNQYVPTFINNLPIVKSVAAGCGHSLALCSDGSLWSWGSNEYGQLGVESLRVLDVLAGDNDNVHPIPVCVESLPVVQSVVAKTAYSLVLCSDGSVWSWGNNEYGQLGDGTTKSRYSPVRVEGLPIELSYGNTVSCKF